MEHLLNSPKFSLPNARMVRFAKVLPRQYFALYGNKIDLNQHLRDLSRKFCSAENFGPGPIFSGKIVPGGTVFSEKNGPVLKILFRVNFLLKIDCNSYDDANHSART